MGIMRCYFLVHGLCLMIYLLNLDNEAKSILRVGKIPYYKRFHTPDSRNSLLQIVFWASSQLIDL